MGKSITSIFSPVNLTKRIISNVSIYCKCVIGLNSVIYGKKYGFNLFSIVEVQRTSPITYKITDLNGEEIKGTFYEPELQKTSQKLFRIEKVIKRGKKKSLVKWKGYSDDFNSWVDNKAIVNIS